jgi:O-antigen ligase
MTDPELLKARRATIAARLLGAAGFWGLFAILCAFTLLTWDGGEIAPLLLSGFTFLLAAAFFSFPPAQKITVHLPVVSLLAMVVYGVLQTSFFPQKIVAYGWVGVLYWLTAAGITLLATQTFSKPRAPARFRQLFVWFGTGICVLDLLEQASKTNRYFWLFPSRYNGVYGPFAYWNNFAQFVELVLPLTLWRGIGGKRPNVPYIVCAAVQIGAVVASGSRAGTVLVVAELLAVILLAYLRNRNRLFLAGALLTIAVCFGFVYAAGFETVIAKLQQNDQLAVRRNIDRSSVAMIRQRPLSGWGLNTYVPVYRMFALYDDGTYVNQAHNDWLEWAAGGGIPFACGMVAILLWAMRPAIRSGWGIGLIAVCMHALVDYPFARFGVCGWWFCLLGMLAASRRTILAPGIRSERTALSAPYGLRAAGRRS